MSVEFGDILKQTLEERGINQKWLADAADTKEATISRYINGVNKSARLDILVSIAKALNVSTDYLLGLTNQQQNNQKLSPEEIVLLRCFKKASRKDAGIVWAVLEDYATESEKEIIEMSNDDYEDLRIGV